MTSGAASSRSPRCYLALSPEFVVYGQIDLDPEECGRDMLWVFATSQPRARLLALRAFRRLARLRPRDKYGGRRWNPDEDGIAHPMKGMSVRRPRLTRNGLTFGRKP